jgi:hypothetical protein
MKTMTIEKRLSSLEKEQRRSISAPKTEFDRQLVARLDAGRERAQAAREAREPSSTSEDVLLPPIPAGTFRGMTRTEIQIHILRGGRQRNHLRWLAAHKEKDHV